MTTFLPIRRSASAALLLTIGLLFSHIGFSQNFKGKDGAFNLATPGSFVINRYAPLASSVSAGALSITLSDINLLRGSYPIANGMNLFVNDAVSKGDLLMIIQVQGADVTTTDDATYGTITNYNNTGNYELRSVFAVAGNTISLCQNLTNSYSQAGRGRTQVIRIPRSTNITLAAGVSLTGQPWNGSTGGIVAIETSGDLVVNGKITADAIGFRGGVDDKNNSTSSGAAASLLYRTTSITTAAGKGESIAGNASDYNTLLDGAYGRGAIANGGGGGNGHNSGGGGGANAGLNNALTPWNGTGLKSSSVIAWKAAWELEATGFSTNISVGGGRGGYSYASSNQDALTYGPGNTVWSGDFRRNNGGFGGRPLNFHSNARVFMGGGGGAGDGNNNASGNGGAGGGIIYLLVNNTISGSGTISANGQKGFDTESSNKDAAGGGGGGGSIIAEVSSGISGITLTANGGNGGLQLSISNESEGPGGGGGGGYIATSFPVTASVAGGQYGISQSTHITEFTPNGATSGNSGTITATSFREVRHCDAAGYILKTTFTDFSAAATGNTATLQWSAKDVRAGVVFYIEKSTDGITFTDIAIAPGAEGDQQPYQFRDRNLASAHILYYRIAVVENGVVIGWSDVRRVIFAELNDVSLLTYPNPVQGSLHIELPSSCVSKPVEIKIYDLTGKIALALPSQPGKHIMQVSTSGLPASAYIIMIKCNNEIRQGRFIRQ